MKVAVGGVDVRLDGVDILQGVDVTVESGTFHGLIGPNGSGKSTLLRCIYRSLRPAAGSVHLDLDDLWRTLDAKQAARRRAVVAQDNQLDLDFCVRDVVAMGRAPHKKLFERDDRHDTELVADALTTVDMGWAADRVYTTLSGGERQRVLVARALAQGAPVLVMDEPTNHLDVRAQVELLGLVASLGLTTIAALHDLDHAVSICDAVTVIEHGHVVASGAPLDVLTVELIRRVFGVDAHISAHPLTGRPHIAVAALHPADRPGTR